MTKPPSWGRASISPSLTRTAGYQVAQRSEARNLLTARRVPARQDLIHCVSVDVFQRDRRTRWVVTTRSRRYRRRTRSRALGSPPLPREAAARAQRTARDRPSRPRSRPTGPWPPPVSERAAFGGARMRCSPQTAASRPPATADAHGAAETGELGDRPGRVDEAPRLGLRWQRRATPRGGSLGRPSHRRARSRRPLAWDVVPRSARFARHGRSHRYSPAPRGGRKTRHRQLSAPDESPMGDAWTVPQPSGFAERRIPGRSPRSSWTPLSFPVPGYTQGRPSRST